MKVIIAFLILNSLVIAAETPPRLMRLYEAEVPADTSAEFYALQRETAEIYKNNKSPVQRLAWTSITGKAKFFTLVPLAGLDKLSERTWLSEQGDEQTRQAHNTRLRRATGTRSVQILSAQDAVSWDPTPDGPPDAFSVVSIYSVKPGKVADFTKLVKQLGDTIQKLGKAKSVHVSRVSYGGDGYTFYIVTGYASLGDITNTSGAFSAAMGADAYAKFTQGMGEVVSSLERQIIRYRPEFSHIPAK